MGASHVWAAAIFAGLLASQAGAAPGSAGQIGAKSRASVRISVSLMPTFAVRREDSGLKVIATNAPHFPFTTVVKPLGESNARPAAEGPQQTPTLLLIVPE